MNTFIVSGSEDGCVYVWHRDTGVLLEVLKGHGRGSVNSVAWHPTEERVFASCSDDGTIRIWQPPPADFDAEVPFSGSMVIPSLGPEKGSASPQMPTSMNPQQSSPPPQQQPQQQSLEPEDTVVENELSTSASVPAVVTTSTT